MLRKITSKLFHNKYNYKIVVVCAGVGMFRLNSLEAVDKNLKQVVVDSNLVTRSNSRIRTQEELDYAQQLHAQLLKLEDYHIRIESPWMSIYTNNPQDVEAIANISTDAVKYISEPSVSTGLEVGTVVLPKVDYDYRVTLGATKQEHSTFVSWAENTSKLKLTKSCKKELLRDRSWGGTYFYVSGDKNLLVSKMHLGGSISKIERIIKP